MIYGIRTSVQNTQLRFRVFDILYMTAKIVTEQTVSPEKSIDNHLCFYYNYLRGFFEKVLIVFAEQNFLRCNYYFCSVKRDF